ncbi:MAG: hypothetical protein ACRDHN_03105, partial [Thermomicrobiales bacterium]
VFLPIGTIQLGPRKICKTDARFPIPPSIGSRVLVMTSILSGPDGELVEITEPEDIVIEHEGGAAVIAKSLTSREPNLSDTTFSGTVGLVEARVASGKGGSK